MHPDEKWILDHLHNSGIVVFQPDDSPGQQAVKASIREIAEANGYLFATYQDATCIVVDQEQHEVKLT